MFFCKAQWVFQLAYIFSLLAPFGSGLFLFPLACQFDILREYPRVSVASPFALGDRFLCGPHGFCNFVLFFCSIYLSRSHRRCSFPPSFLKSHGGSCPWNLPEFLPRRTPLTQGFLTGGFFSPTYYPHFLFFPPSGPDSHRQNLCCKLLLESASLL